MHISGTHHVAILTPDLARLRAFYTGLLGLPVVGGFPEHNILFIAVGNTVIELEEQDGQGGRSRSGSGGGWHHLALEVDDVDAAHAELSARGVPFHVPPTDFPEGAPGGPAMRIAFFTDPDGNTLELVQPYERHRGDDTPTPKAPGDAPRRHDRNPGHSCRSR